MKKALVQTNTKIMLPDGNYAYPLAEITDTPFEVHPSLIWVDVEDNVKAGEFFWDGKKIIQRPSDDNY